MDGVINVLKPKGITSFDVVRDIRKIAKIKKVGHTGTLDPLASGVLPVCIGKATKIVDYIMEGTKTYRVEMKLGTTTDTYDREGTVLEEKEVSVSPTEVEKAIEKYKGDIKQVPPMYSALKVNGRKLYDLARKGIEVEREARKIQIHDICILSIDMPYIIFDVKCSKGTYIRSLCFDIGNDLGSGAVMWNLERLEASPFNIKEAIKLEDLNEENIKQFITPIDEALKDYEKLYLDKKFEKLVLNGVILKDRRVLDNIEENKLYRTYIEDDNFIGLGMKNAYGFKIHKLLT
ncbi:tRNA pseudouridine(55) synthase TruB [Clostridium sporogenes]|jgi:tRNA pseudouridine55 synthase|uniref:tRNA pseudouridine synthase B n=2 Tax=Clostridium TaxID=1485 RepID=A0A0D1A0A8_CLOBO|nr:MULTISPECIES: tRNA pseudouridine(55) synthase TruB [Clostridium]MBE6077476.1 tRNA pseudouridine(55) synthase TruB [Clostridium lundense]MDU2833867.1 tRNA pseudouridine(55) synthase TruB [Clostridium botulinum]EDU36419.1 tRNA pseudouridine synthase B [Clostridium sporogenes ATCC 15579]KIS24243.1 tRNA pseudouridine synthase B [Clostridium botulinum B2 450]MCW6094209.1 tRNA pseudouridine(55) synthase TruB [Clostridium sporogenes]